MIPAQNHPTCTIFFPESCPEPRESSSKRIQSPIHLFRLPSPALCPFPRLRSLVRTEDHREGRYLPRLAYDFAQQNADVVRRCEQVFRERRGVPPFHFWRMWYWMPVRIECVPVEKYPAAEDAATAAGRLATAGSNGGSASDGSGTTEDDDTGQQNDGPGDFGVGFDDDDDVDGENDFDLAEDQLRERPKKVSPRIPDRIPNRKSYAPPRQKQQRVCAFN